MTTPSPADVPQSEAPLIPPGTAELLEGMSEEQAALALGLGVLVQRAAETEYILHGLYAHLDRVERPYTDDPHETVTHFIKKAKTRLAAIPEDQIPAQDRAALLHDLDLCAARFAERNRYIHSCWVYDDEVYGWRTVKGTKGLSRPDIGLVSSEDVWELASEFSRLRSKLIAWDAHYFGAAGDPDLAVPPASSKRL
ncbi:hypothetical protein OHB35_52690 [Streptomyces phaeochromogenes]|uniref:Uncharacterized protein n=1 Tax=Streptomyces phaeochromogenes TaxID=1923 RepID=A0ABZ1HRH9_STRPH|nr:hypothetical protein [Streptomyces phaeochromogenes]WSD21207.1 hypothetical protein OHB35_52690 [Streptomyces phaeochromogenes]